MEKTNIGIILALASTCSWALCTIIFKKLGEKLEPIGMTMMKASLSAIFLSILMYITNINFQLPTEFLWKIFLSGLLGIVIGDSLFFAALNKLSPLVLSLILFVGPDIFSGIFGIIFLGEKTSLFIWVGVITTIIGLSFFIFPIKQSEKNSYTSLTGIIFALLSLCCTAYSMVIIKPVLAHCATLTVTMYRMFFSSVILIIYAVISKKIFSWRNTLKDKNYNIKFALTVTIASYGGFWLSLGAIKYCNLIIASTLMTLEPLFIFLFSVLFCHYIPLKKEIVGFGLSIIGIIIISLG